MPCATKNLFETASSFWLLYYNRVFLNYWWFGQPLRDKMNLVAETGSPKYLLPHISLPDPEHYKPWYMKNLDVFKSEMNRTDQQKSVRNEVEMDESNPKWAMFKNALDLLAREKITTVIFMHPRNRELLNRLSLNGSFILSCQSKIAELIQQYGITVLDYTWKIDSKNFVDRGHPNAEGNQKLANLLVQDLLDRGLIK
jgi:hypothetical protein